MGEIFVLGGHDHEADQLNSMERFDPSSGTWAPSPNMHTERSAFAAVVLGGELYALGGLDNEYDKLASVERFVPRAGTWVKAPPMATARSDHAAAVLGDLR